MYASLSRNIFWIYGALQITIISIITIIINRHNETENTDFNDEDNRTRWSRLVYLSSCETSTLCSRDAGACEIGSEVLFGIFP